MEPADVVEDVLHEPTQHHDDVVDLTLGAVERVVAPGRVDFGGGELEDAETAPVETTPRNVDDEYEWWTLRAGRYLVTLNESLTGEGTAVVQPRTELLERGASLPTVQVVDLPRLPLGVGGAGIRLKENARVSTVVDVRE